MKFKFREFFFALNNPPIAFEKTHRSPVASPLLLSSHLPLPRSTRSRRHAVLLPILSLLPTVGVHRRCAALRCGPSPLPHPLPQFLLLYVE
jgi:hypothetical protein